MFMINIIKDWRDWQRRGGARQGKVGGRKRMKERKKGGKEEGRIEEEGKERREGKKVDRKTGEKREGRMKGKFEYY